MNRDNNGRFVKGHKLSPNKKWTTQNIIERLKTIYHANETYTQKAFKRNHPSLESAMTYHFGSRNLALAAAGIPIIRRHDADSALKLVKPILTAEKAKCVAWLSETACGKNKGGSWLIHLETPELELAQLMIQDFTHAYGYIANLCESNRNTYNVRICSKTIVEEMLSFATKEKVPSGKTKFLLKQWFIQQRNSQIDRVFLQRFFDCEGSVFYDTSGRSIHICATNISFRLMNNQIASMIRDLGIDCVVIKDDCNHKKDALHSIAWRVRVNKKIAVRKFQKTIDFSLSRKKNKLLALINSLS